MSYAIVCDGCGTIVVQMPATQLMQVPAEVWCLQLPDAVTKLHLCNEQCLVRWAEQRRMEQVGSGEVNGDD